ncbi:hypothetical protein AGMMS4956_15040 [Bacteroidia bacterium]|nr:hypothetical protein AGMMS4956_15040 [Bacteroidia bacterium]
MKQMKKLLLILMVILSSCVSQGNREKAKNNGKVTIKGTFVQTWLCASWNNTQWDTEFAALKEAGMEYLIIAPMLQVDENGNKSALYPSAMHPDAPDVLEKCLQHAQKNGFKVFLGLNMNERWWKVNYPGYWLDEQMEIGNKVADEILARYKNRYGETLYGWYWVWEVDNLNWNTDEKRNMLANALNINLDHLSEVSPDMPLMLSPFMNYRVGVNAEGYGQLWKEVFAQAHFRPGDIFAPQDCLGAGGLTFDLLPKWFDHLKAAVETKSGLLFWSNVENFEQHSWVSATMDKYAQQIEMERPYVSGMITFAYSHYYSPLACNRMLHDAYVYYYKNGCLPEVAVPKPVSNATLTKDGQGNNVLQWTLPEAEPNLLGVRIYKNSNLIRYLQTDKTGVCVTSFTDENSLLSDLTYQITTYNVIGKESVAITVN